MSLIGSLEDLSLGDILQIISLSQKSGVLVLRADSGDGRMLFRSGLVCGATIKRGPHDLRSLLVGSRVVSEAAFEEAARACTDDDDAGVAHALVEAGHISADDLAARQRQAVEAAVVAMFRWRTGEFSFDVREQREAEDPPIFAPLGINAQYLAMEAARLDDESRQREPALYREAGEPGELALFREEDEASEPASVDSIEGVETVEVDDPAPSDAASDAEAPLLVAEAVDTLVEVTAQAVDGADDVRAPVGRAESFRERFPAVIVIDHDLLALEWAKEALQKIFDTVHIFQRQDLGLARIRQYLARAHTPCVLVSSDTDGDRLSGIVDAADFVKRLKQQSPGMPVAWLGQYGTALPERGAADGGVRRPSHAELRDPRAEVQREESAQVLRAEVLCVLGEPPQPVPAPPPAVSPGVDELREVTQELCDASTRGEVLPLVMSFAGQRFARVALFMVRDTCAVGLVASGEEIDESKLKGFELDVADSAWFAGVLESGGIVQQPPENAGDQCVVAALGGAAPAFATVAPIESGGQIVALLYGDCGAGSTKRVDTAALEVVLHHAGLALDRAALERALAESDAGA